MLIHDISNIWKAVELKTWQIRNENEFKGGYCVCTSHWQYEDNALNLVFNIKISPCCNCNNHEIAESFSARQMHMIIQVGFKYFIEIADQQHLA